MMCCNYIKCYNSVQFVKLDGATARPKNAVQKANDNGLDLLPAAAQLIDPVLSHEFQIPSLNLTQRLRRRVGQIDIHALCWPHNCLDVTLCPDIVRQMVRMAR